MLELEKCEASSYSFTLFQFRLFGHRKFKICDVRLTVFVNTLTKKLNVNHRLKKIKKLVFESMLFKDLKVFVWLGPITMMVTVYGYHGNLYNYHFRCVYPVLLIHKST